MKILQFVPFPPPYPHGIADYARVLCEGFRHQYQLETCFLIPDTEQIRELLSPTEKETEQFERCLVRPGDIRQVVKHYAHTDEMIAIIYHSARSTSNFSEILIRLKQALSHSRLVTVFHEMPRNPSLRDRVKNSLKRLLFKSPQNTFNLGKTMAASDQVVVVTNRYSDTLAHWSHKVHYLPCFSNIGEPLHVPQWRERENSVIVFGSSGTRDRIYTHHFDALIECCRRFQFDTIIDIGPLTDVTSETSHRGDVNLQGIEIVRKGYQSPTAISRLMQTAKAGFFDNYSRLPGSLGKSGVFAAYAAHGLLPVTWRPDPSEQDGLESGTHYLAVSDAQAAVSSEALQRIATAAHQWYQTHDIENSITQYFNLLHGTATYGE